MPIACGMPGYCSRLVTISPSLRFGLSGRPSQQPGIPQARREGWAEVGEVSNARSSAPVNSLARIQQECTTTFVAISWVQPDDWEASPPPGWASYNTNTSPQLQAGHCLWFRRRTKTQQGNCLWGPWFRFEPGRNTVMKSEVTKADCNFFSWFFNQKRKCINVPCSPCHCDLQAQALA